jgi:hypothetical protein
MAPHQTAHSLSLIAMIQLILAIRVVLSGVEQTEAHQLVHILHTKGYALAERHSRELQVARGGVLGKCKAVLLEEG